MLSIYQQKSCDCLPYSMFAWKRFYFNKNMYMLLYPINHNHNNNNKTTPEALITICQWIFRTVASSRVQMSPLVVFQVVSRRDVVKRMMGIGLGESSHSWPYDNSYVIVIQPEKLWNIIVDVLIQEIYSARYFCHTVVFIIEEKYILYHLVI